MPRLPGTNMIMPGTSRTLLERSNERANTLLMTPTLAWGTSRAIAPFQGTSRRGSVRYSVWQRRAAR
jgi:hypothetical protein